MKLFVRARNPKIYTWVDTVFPHFTGYIAALLFGHKYALLLVPAQAFEYFHQLKNIALPNMK